MSSEMNELKNMIFELLSTVKVLEDELLGKYMSVAQVADKFNVSPQSIYYRLENDTQLIMNKDYRKRSSGTIEIARSSLYKLKPKRRKNL